MRNLRTLILAAGAMGLLAACATTDTRYDYDRRVDLTKIHTYRWVVLEGAERPNQLMDNNIREAIDNTLARKGLRRVDNDPADALVAYQISLSQEQQITSYGGGYGYGVGYGYGGWGGGGIETATTSTIHIGTLIFDFYDPASKNLLWRGQASKTLNPSKDPAKNRERLQIAVDKLLETFPPPPKA
jgi:uncharacterized protein DUF4136